MAESDVVIALDCMGGDNAPGALLRAANLLLREESGVFFLLFGDESAIAPVVNSLPMLRAQSEIIHSEGVISDEMRPSLALRRSAGTSMRLAIESVASGRAQGVLSAGNTGALAAISMRVIGLIDGMRRPAILVALPSQDKPTLLLDAGANVGCDAHDLLQFAVVGSVCSQVMYDIPEPLVGLLNIGSELHKGDLTIANASKMLQTGEVSVNFYGYVEPADIVKSAVDVVVCDGMLGNIALKSLESGADLAIFWLKTVIRTSFVRRAVGALLHSLITRDVKKVQSRYIKEGGLLVGMESVVVKSHGSSDEKKYMSSLRFAVQCVRRDVSGRIASEMESIDSVLEGYDRVPS